MPFRPKNVIQKMTNSCKNKSHLEKNAVLEDIKFLKSMMTVERKSSYQGVDKTYEKKVEDVISGLKNDL